MKFSKGVLTGVVNKKLASTNEYVRLPIKITFHESGSARVTIDEEKRQKGEIELRHDSKARKQRYNEAERWAVVGGTSVNTGAALMIDAPKGTTRISYHHEATTGEVLELPSFDLFTITSATENFAITNKIGEGGFGPVYKVRFNFIGIYVHPLVSTTP